MKKIIFEYINKENEEICVLVNEEQDTLYKINMNDATMSFVQNTWLIEEILEDVRDELYVANDYVNDLRNYIIDQDIILNIMIYNEECQQVELNNEIQRERKNDNPIKSISEEINNRDKTYYGIYHDVGVVLDNFSTFELFKYYISVTGETSIRSYLEEGIIADVIHKERNGGK